MLDGIRHVLYKNLHRYQIEIEHDLSFRTLYVELEDKDGDSFELKNFNLSYDRYLNVRGAKTVYLENVKANTMSFDARELTMQKCWTRGIDADYLNKATFIDAKRSVKWLSAPHLR